MNPSLCSLSDVKDYLAITTTTDDYTLSRLVSATSDFIITQTGLQFAGATYTDTWDGDGGRDHIFFVTPAFGANVASVTVNGSGILPRPDVTSSGYVIEPAGITLTSDFQFTEGIQNCTVTYTIGAETVPNDVQQAAIELVSLKYRDRLHIGNQTESIAGSSITFLPAQIPTSVLRIIDSYRKIWW